MCKVNINEEVLNNEEYINYQTGEALDLEKVKQLKDNVMLKVKPDLWCGWNFEKNDKLGFDVWKMTKGMEKKAWWTCDLGHEWTATVKDRVRGNGCPCCSGRSVWIGFNDMWTTAPKQAELLLNPEDGYKYARASNQRADWKCPSCGEIIKSRLICEVNDVGLCCKVCSDGIPISEKIMYSLLKTLNVNFIYDKSQEWSQNKRYDFFIPSINTIIETHGSQHYDTSFGHLGGRTLKQEQENDEYKLELATENGIEHYITIDCRKSDFEFIKNNIIHSELSTLLNVQESNFTDLSMYINNSLVIETWELWNSGVKSSGKISKLINLHQSTIAKYLSVGASMGKVDYSKAEIDNMKANAVVQLEVGTGNLISQFNSIHEAERSTSLSRKTIVNACKGKAQRSGGYKWMYLTDYRKFLDGGIEVDFGIKAVKYDTRKVMQLDLDGNYIKEWDSIISACNMYDIKSANLSAVCRGVRKSAKGYKWMYKEDYIEEHTKVV